MKVRLMGTDQECAETVGVLAACRDLEVLSVSDPYPCRGDSALVRVYVDVRLVDLAEVQHYHREGVA